MLQEGSRVQIAIQDRRKDEGNVVMFEGLLQEGSAYEATERKRRRRKCRRGEV